MGPSNYQINNIVRSYSRKLTRGLSGQAGKEAETGQPTAKAIQADNAGDLEFMNRITAGVITTVTASYSEADQANRQALHRVAANLHLSAAKDRD